jgi:hypothetical protein
MREQDDAATSASVRTRAEAERSHAGDGRLNEAAASRDQNAIAASGRLGLTKEAVSILQELHDGTREMLTPLGGAVSLKELVIQLQQAAQAEHHLPLTNGVALGALEVSRHQQGAGGWPAVEAALLCLRRCQDAEISGSTGGCGGCETRQAPTTRTCTAPPSDTKQQKETALQELGRLEEALGEGAMTSNLHHILREGKFPGQASAQTSGSNANANNTGIHPKDARRRAAAQTLRTLLGRNPSEGADDRGSVSSSDEGTCGGDGARVERPAGRGNHTRNRAEGDRIAERPCGDHHHSQLRTTASSQRTTEHEGNTPDSARHAAAEHQRRVAAASDELERKVSEAVASAMKAALPQLGKEQLEDQDSKLLSNLRKQLASPDLRGLSKREALAIAAKRAARNLEGELLDAHSSQQRERCRKLKRKHSGDDAGLSGSDSSSDSDSGSDLSSDDSDHSRNRGRHNRGIPFPSPAARAAAMSQLPTGQATSTGTATVVVVGNTKLPVWRAGSEANLQGFNWKTKQHIYHLWEQYMLAEGQHAPKEFKSLIAPELIPVICAETGLKASDWPFLQDSLVIAKIDKALRPTRSTDFALQLQQITLSNGKPGTLLQRYRQFAERFLAKVAEAEAADRPVKDNVVKDAFKDALRSEGVLKMWMREVDWRGVGKAHRRLMRKLKESHSWDKLRDENERKGANKWRKDEDGERAPKQWQRRQRDEIEVNFAASKDVKTRGGDRFLKGKRPSEQKEANSPLRGPQPGLDKRGPSWHTSTVGISCRSTPCKSKFCQRCGNHGHTVETCRMPDDTPGINLQGYFQDKKGKGATPISRGPRHPFGSPPEVHSNAAQRRGSGKASTASKRSKEDGAANESSSDEQ